MALVECPECSGKVSTGAVACPHCGHPLQVENDAEDRRSQKSGCLGIALKAMGVIAGIFLLMLSCAVISQLGKSGGSVSTGGSVDHSPAPSTAGPVLKVGEWHWGEEYGYVTAEGRVTNISAEKLENIQAVVTFETKDGTLVTTEDALIDYNPLMPGQTSPWKVMAKANPAMERAQLEFKRMFGGTLTTTH